MSNNDPIIVVSQLKNEQECLHAFDAWLHDFDAVDDSDSLLKRVACSDAPVPAELLNSLDLPIGSTYADAAQLFLDRWKK